MEIPCDKLKKKKNRAPATYFVIGHELGHFLERALKDSFKLSVTFSILPRDTLLFGFHRRTVFHIRKKILKQKKKRSDLTSTANTVNKLL